MSEFAMVRKFFEDGLVAVGVLEKTDEAQKLAIAAQQATMRAQDARAEAVAAAEKAKTDADAYVRNRKAMHDKAEADSAAKIKAAEDKHTQWLADTKAKADEASERLSGIQREITEATARRDAIHAEIAKHRSSLAELAAKF